MSIDPKLIRLQGGSKTGRYVYSFADGSEAEMDFFESHPGVVTITHTGTPRQHRGQGVAATLVTRAMEDFRAAGQKVIPACWFARDQFAEHPEWADLLYRG